MLVLKKNYHRIYFDYQFALHRGKDFASEPWIKPRQMGVYIPSEFKVEASLMGVYIHCYLHPMLDRMRRDEELTPNRKLDLFQGIDV